MTRPGPKRSAKPPATAPIAPQARFCSAIENENTSLPQPYSRLIGCRKRPKPARMPNEMHMMMQPQARTTAGVRQDFSIAAVYFSRPANQGQTTFFLPAFFEWLAFQKTWSVPDFRVLIQSLVTCGRLQARI